MKATRQVAAFPGKSQLMMSNVWGSVARKLSEMQGQENPCSCFSRSQGAINVHNIECKYVPWISQLVLGVWLFSYRAMVLAFAFPTDF